MTNILIGIGAAAVAFVIAYKVTKKKYNSVGEGIESEMSTLRGELIDLAFDPELKLTRITVRDNDGVTQYGFSNLSVKQLETLYVGKGYVTIPVVKNKRSKYTMTN